jgi:hypothetical protein
MSGTVSKVRNWLYIIRHRKHQEYDHIVTEILNPSSDELYCEIEKILKHDMIAQFGKVGLCDGNLRETSPYSRLIWMYDKYPLDTMCPSFEECISKKDRNITETDIGAIKIIYEKNGRSWEYEIHYSSESKPWNRTTIDNPSFEEIKGELIRIKEKGTGTITDIRKKRTHDYIENNKYGVRLPRNEDFMYIYESHGWWKNLEEYTSRLEFMDRLKYLTDVDIEIFRYMV